ncbi:IclR family transcriptional regulator [Burkholderia stagnalis]|uniref:IclR family transcriptional regulator n=1 Tax=Burkholderia stagnalis TaxID=1503054 RepID=UPI0007562B38|nr:IclR family transcriptional regulator [Burkholderia stagnalis]KVC58976.1 IclR family transcriptional regulator [Burkholderia stagnalis]KVD96154.1 IclR family transcriptional regulator [Burkholderia stagnalis]KVN21824.1 IclR family transcriptional regulator [Burkholderia stagnalis]KWI65303.1 IclR family transcriptional regulator [Burkholderia stagnalis]KWK50918.1 IclR family transcriptional regulator [Burkholderia stagnalis]
MPTTQADHPGDGPGAPADEASSGVAVLDRAFAILRAFGPTDDRLSLAELSRRTGLYKSTILRLLAALEHGGFMRKLDDGQYAIGHEPLRLAALYQRSFRVGPVVEPLLETLSRELGETASFYVREGDKRSVLYRVEPARAVRVSIRVGEEFPVRQGASGKVLLAFTDTQDARWNDVREQLWAASYGERDPETASASVPVFDAAGACVGALTVSGPKSRLAAAPVMVAAIAMLLPLAQKATVALGGAGARYDAAAVRDSLARLRSAADDAG